MRQGVFRAAAVRRGLWGIALAGIVTLSACSSPYSNHARVIKESLLREDYDNALQRAQELNNGRSRLLYFYETGLIHHYQGDYEASNSAFDGAETLYEDLYTKSLSRELGALLTSDVVIKYRGERYEAALIHYYKILNYLYLGQAEGALVECRKLNHRLQTFEDDEAESDYTADPFLQYVTGMVYQALGEYGDANVSLRVALEEFHSSVTRPGVDVPDDLYFELADNAESMNDPGAAEAFRDSVGAARILEGRDGRGTLNLFLECGYVPYKLEENLILPIYKGEINDGLDTEEYATTLYDRRNRPRNRRLKLDYVLKVSVPVIVPSAESPDDADVRAVVEGQPQTFHAPLLENVEALSLGAFEDHKVAMIMKTILRGLTKYVAKRSAAKKDAVAGWLVNAFNVATEAADTRSWASLPQSIRASRIVLPAGTYDLEVTLYDSLGDSSRQFVIPDVEIIGGTTRFLNYRMY